MTTLRLKPGIVLTWSRPDSVIAPFCSVCFKHIPDDDVQMMMWDKQGACVQFCDDCVENIFEPEPVRQRRT